MLRDELQEMQRIAARGEKIKKLLAEASAEDGQPQADEVAPAAPVQPILYPPLRPWEKVINGRREQYRPMTSSEADAENERHFLKKQWQANQAHAAKVSEAVKEAQAEEKATAKRAEHEKKTGRRAYGERRFISLEEACYRGYLGSGGGDNAEHPGMYGLFARGRLAL